MPERTIVRKTLRDVRWHVAGWGVGLACLAAMLVLLYPLIAEQFEGVEMENIGFGEIGDFSNPREFFQVEFFTWSPVLMTVFAIIVGGALLAGEEGAGHPRAPARAAAHAAGGSSSARSSAARSPPSASSCSRGSDSC